MYGQSKYQMASRFCKELGFGFGKKVSPVEAVMSSIKNQVFDKTSWKNEEPVPKKQEKDVSKYKVGQKISHPKFGEGQIINISSDGLVGDIEFEDFGKKSLMLNIADLTILED